MAGTERVKGRKARGPQMEAGRRWFRSLWVGKVSLRVWKQIL